MKRKKPEELGVPEWVLTYGDLMSLLLCFFILLAAFSELKKPREYQLVHEKIKEALGVQGGFGTANITRRSTNSSIRMQQEQARAADDRSYVDETVEPNVPGSKPRVSSPDDSERQRVSDSLPFELGSVDLSPRNKDRLRAFADKVRGQRFVVQVEGHAYGADDWTVAGLKSANEISFYRAEAVREFLVRECGIDGRILRVLAAGTSAPLVTSQTSAEQNERNRRVELYQTGEVVPAG